VCKEVLSNIILSKIYKIYYERGENSFAVFGCGRISWLWSYSFFEPGLCDEYCIADAEAVRLLHIATLLLAVFVMFIIVVRAFNAKLYKNQCIVYFRCYGYAQISLVSFILWLRTTTTTSGQKTKGRIAGGADVSPGQCNVTRTSLMELLQPLLLPLLTFLLRKAPQHWQLMFFNGLTYNPQNCPFSWGVSTVI